MKIFRNVLFGMFVFLILFCSCSGGMDQGGNTQQEKEKEEKKVEEEKEENTDEDEDEYEDEDEDEKEEEDETEDEDTEDIKEVSKEKPPVPVFLYCKVVLQNKVVFGFSQPVKMIDLSFTPTAELEVDDPSGTELKYEVAGGGRTITVNLAENLESGRVWAANFLAEDAYGNSIDKQVLFSSTVTPAPALQITELRTESSKPKAEFIEFKMLSDGNLGALRVFAVGNKTPKIYDFKSVEVKEGEYVVLHLRTYEDSCKDEYGANLNESGGTDSSPAARDLWIAGSTKYLRKTDAVYVLDQDDWVLDAVMLAETPSPSWANNNILKAAEFLLGKDAWKSPAGMVCSPADAVNSSKTTATRSICRDETVENTHTAADWYITVSSGSTPGKKNNPNRFF